MDNNTQLKFSFEKAAPHQPAPIKAERSAKMIKFDPKSELYKRILNRK